MYSNELYNELEENKKTVKNLIPDNPKNKEFKNAIECPNKIFEELDELFEKISKNLTMIKIPEIKLQNVRQQINFILPLGLKKCKSDYSKNLIKDLGIYRIAYEDLAKSINKIINDTKEKIKKLYDPLNRMKGDLIKYLMDFIESIRNILKTVQNKKEGLDPIDESKYIKLKKLKEAREEILKKITEFEKMTVEYKNKYVDSITRIEKLINDFLKYLEILIEHVKALSNNISEGFIKFEGSSITFNDTKNVKLIEQTLTKIKEPLESIKNSINASKDEFGKLENFIEELRGCEDIKREKFEICNELQKKADEIINDINNFRDKLGEIKKELQKINIKPPAPAVFSKSFSELGSLLNVAKNGIQSVEKEQKDKIEVLESRIRIDILFIMDITGSMGTYLEDAKKSMNEIIEGIKKHCPGVEIYIGFIGYRDFSDLDLGVKYINIELTNDAKNITNEIADVRAEGGGDVPEDVADAFQKAKEKKWEGHTKFAVFVTDSPCHGEKYHDLRDEDRKDMYPEGDPKGRNVEDYIKYFAENNISLYCVRIEDITDKMFNIFQEIYNKNKKDNSVSSFKIGESEKLSKIIIENATELYKNRKD